MKNEFKVGDLVEASLHDTNGIIIQSSNMRQWPQKVREQMGGCRFLVRLINGKQRWVSPRDLRLLAAAAK
jgi:hypothetical protein